MGGDSISGRSSSSGSAVDDGRDTALDEKTTARSENPPEEKALGMSRGFFFGRMMCVNSGQEMDHSRGRALTSRVL